MSTPVSRATVRAALAALLTTGVSAAQRVYDHQAELLNGESPVVCVTSASSERARMTLGDTRGRAGFVVDVHLFVAYKATGWTPKQAEDMLDTLEQQVAAVVFANPRTTSWAGLAYAEPSVARDTVTIGGTVYLHEVVAVSAIVL
jgi:hypothetical protein